MKNTLLSTLKITAITFLLSAAACNDANTNSENSNGTMANSSDSSATGVNELTTAASTVMNAEGNGTVESRQIQATDGAGGAPGSDEGMSTGSITPANTGSTANVNSGSKNK